MFLNVYILGLIKDLLISDYLNFNNIVLTS